MSITKDKMKWQPPEPLITTAGMRFYAHHQLLAVRREAIEECLDIVFEKRDSHYDVALRAICKLLETA